MFFKGKQVVRDEPPFLLPAPYLSRLCALASQQAVLQSYTLSDARARGRPLLNYLRFSSQILIVKRELISFSLFSK